MQELCVEQVATVAGGHLMGVAAPLICYCNVSNFPQKMVVGWTSIDEMLFKSREQSCIDRGYYPAKGIKITGLPLLRGSRTFIDEVNDVFHDIVNTDSRYSQCTRNTRT